MDYCTTHFGVRLEALTFTDVEAFFKAERTETDQLEFKSYAGTLDKNLPGIIKSVCGFLNSKGGLLILGAPVGTVPLGKTEKTFIGNLTPIGESIEKDRLISRISDKIVSLPQGIRLQIIENQNKQSLCIMEIDESEYAPHQAEGTYYMRIDGQTRPAPHHYVEALFRKIRYPNLEGYLVVTKSQVERNGSNSAVYYLAFDAQFHNWSPLQNVEDLSFQIVVHPGKFIQSDKAEYYGVHGGTYRRTSYEPVIHYGLGVVSHYEIIISSAEAVKVDHVVKVLLTFGGRNCPSKSSSYELDLKRSGSTGNLDLQMVVKRTENKLFKDIQDELGQNKQSILKTILGRTVN